MNELALFAGGGGGILASRLLGFHTVGAVEIEPSAREMLLARQRDGFLPAFPVWDDVRSFDGKPWRGCVDVISGGFPCQDISVAGKGAGIEGERSGLWREMFRIVCEVRPRFVFVENSPMLVSRGLSVVLGDLAGAGYDACWCVLGADDVGAPHVRKRLWLLAHDSHAHLPGCEEQRGSCSAEEEYPAAECGLWWGAEPALGRVADGVAHRVDRLRALGNGQVPLVAAVAFKVLRKRLIGG